MPRVLGVMQLPPNTYGIAGQSVKSVPYNVVLDDFVAEMNGPRPISAGGTGGTTQAEASVALGIPDAIALAIGNQAAIQVALFIAYSGVK